MRLLLQDEYIYAGLGSLEMKAAADSKGNFSFVVKDIKNFKKIRLELVDHVFMIAYIEPGDRMKVSYSGAYNRFIKVTDFKFSGPGSAKLALATEMTFGAAGPQLKLSPSIVYDQSKLDSLLTYCDTLYAFKMGIVNSYGSGISKTIRNLYRADAFGASYNMMMNHLNMVKRIQITSHDVAYLLSKIEQRDIYHKLEISSESPEYLDFLWKKSKFKISQTTSRSPGNINRSVFEDLVSSTKGQLREKAILYFVCANSNFKLSADAAWVYQRASELIGTIKHHQFLQSVLDSRKLGVKAFDFKLINLQGDTVYLHDFKGKVVVLEAWYTGCGGCAAMAKVIKSTVLPKFGNHKDVVFLAVNVDQGKKQWQLGLESGLYTNENSINLSTYGLGVHHPLLQYYKFISLPQLLLIGKDGNLISMDATRKGDVINERIEKALNKT